jgi:transcriptional regulator with XRE-family HTH domain
MSTGNETAQIPRWTLADRLRKALEFGGISSAEMAQYLEVHRNTVSNWIYGHAKPPASAVKLWSMRTGVSYPWLTYGDTIVELPRVDSNHQPAGLEKDHQPITRAEIISMRKHLPIGVPSIVQSAHSR